MCSEENFNYEIFLRGAMGIQIISFSCLLKNRVGHLLSTTYNHEVISSLNEDDPVLAGLVRGLQNLTKGEKRSIQLRADEAYGFYDPKKVILYPRNKLVKHLKVGDLVAIKGKSGQIRHYKAVQLHDDMVSLDGNHPLAGQDLVFEIEALQVRNATPEEISQSSNKVSQVVLH